MKAPKYYVIRTLPAFLISVKKSVFFVLINTKITMKIMKTVIISMYDMPQSNKCSSR
jgi:hypothetical protein